ncbi:hypothetical protein RND81_01G094900 [Saponaria officinalis]|uniref:Uncharacterized protein n=1 Tax=Saponaria officinalis TaxID=3572 RepID=A0AAW1N6I7_SAPOF
MKKDATSWSMLSFLPTIWTLWCTRNDLVFSDTFHPLKLINLYKCSLDLAWFASLSKKPTMVRIKDDDPLESLHNYYPVCLISIQDTCIPTRIKVDAAWNSNGKVGYGWVILLAGAFLCFRFLVAKEWKTHYKLKLKLSKKLLNRQNKDVFFISMSNLTASKRLPNCVAFLIPRTILGPLLPTSLILYPSFIHCCCFSFVHRYLNKCAHFLASRAKQL